MGNKGHDFILNDTCLKAKLLVESTVCALLDSRSSWNLFPVIYVPAYHYHMCCTTDSSGVSRNTRRGEEVLNPAKR